jgi:uncharacterized membrane protein YecN with MAPEG domain
MEEYARTVAVTALSLLVYASFGIQVGRVRRKTGIAAPIMSGDPLLERAIRVHENTLEWLPIYLVSLWLFAWAWGDLAATVVGLVWVVGRLLYSRGYMADPSKREAGFLVQLLASAVLLFGAFGRALWLIATGA